MNDAEPYLKRQAEKRAMNMAILGYFGIKLFPEENNRNQEIGEYCNKKDLPECQRLFGVAINQACRTCPN